MQNLVAVNRLHAYIGSHKIWGRCMGPPDPLGWGVIDTYKHPSPAAVTQTVYERTYRDPPKK